MGEEAEKFKAQGNALFKEKKYEEAIKQYNKAITLDPENASYYSNRAAAWSLKGNHDSALADANKCIQKDPNFVKGYSRKGKAYFDMGKMAEAEESYKEGLSKEPGNAGCSSGLEDIKQARSRASWGAGGGGGGAGGLLGSLTSNPVVQQVIDKVKNGGKMQKYMMIMVAYFLFTNLTGRGRTTQSNAPPDPIAEDDEPAVASVGPVSRRFKDLDGMWLSYMQTDSKAESMLLLLHRTSLSAEVEFGMSFPSFAKVAGHSARLIAPDRPCHGFSPCPSGGEPKDASLWLNRLVRAGGPLEKVTVVAVGREAAAEALALASKRKEVNNILLLSPKVVAPARGDMTKAKASDLGAWLGKHGYATSGQAAADAIRWVAAGASNEEKKSPIELNVEKLPADCRVTLLYDTGDEEDEELRQDLDKQGTEVKTRSTTGDDALHDILADEMQQALSPEAAGVDMES